MFNFTSIIASSLPPTFLQSLFVIYFDATEELDLTVHLVISKEKLQ